MESQTAHGGRGDNAPATKHTPGPWIQLANVSGMGLSIRIHTDYGLRLVASVGTHDVNMSNGKGGVYNKLDDHREVEANARLIAAAPDLLTSLRALRDIIHDDLTHAAQRHHADAISAADAALANAGGAA